jgi:hypothetical protein
VVPQKLRIRNKYFFIGSNNEGLFLDNFVFKKGESTRSGQGSLPSTNNSNTIVLLDFNTNFNDSDTLEQTAQASITSSASITAAIGYKTNASSNISSVVTLGCNAHKNVKTTVDIASQANINTNNLRVRYSDAAISAASSLTVSSQITANVESSLTSSFTQDTINSRTRAVGISTDSVASQLSAVAKIGDFLIAFDANITSAVQAVKTTDIQSNQSVQFTMLTNAVKTTDIADNLSAVSSQSITANRIRSTNSDIAATATTVSDVNYSAGAVSSLSSNVEVLAETSGIIRANADLNTSSSLTATATRNRFAVSDLSTAVTLAADAITVLQSAANLAISASTVIDNSRTRDNAVQTDSIATQLSVVAKTGQGFITLDAPVTLNIGAVKTTDISSTLIAQTDSQSIIGSIKQANISLTATLSLSADGVTGVVGESYNTVTASISIAATKTTDVQSNNQITSNISVQAVRTRRFGINMFASGGQLIEGRRIKFAQANMSINTALTCLGGVNLVILNQTLFNQASLTAAVRVIHIDPYTTWQIAREDRDWMVAEEDRLRTIDEEIRTYIIEGA